jgi:hypothetical protein
VLTDWGAVLGAVVDGARPWSGAAELAAVLGWQPERLSPVIDDLIINGLIVEWARPGSVSYTLTPLSADGLNVHIVERGYRTVWAPRCSPGRPPAGSSTPEGYDPPDPSPGPAELAADREESGRWRPRGPLEADRFPRPRLILTGSETVWRERAAPVAGKRLDRKALAARRRFRCSACKGLRLEPDTYCARCCRWGRDGTIAAHRRAAAAAARGNAS